MGSNGNGRQVSEPDWTDPSIPSYIRKGFLFQSERMKDMRREVLGEMSEIKGLAMQTHALVTTVAVKVGVSAGEIDAVEHRARARLAKEREARIKLEGRVDGLEQKANALASDVEDTGQRNIDAVIRKAAELEAEKRDRETWMSRHRVGVFTSIMLVILAACFGAYVKQLQEDNHKHNTTDTR
jgi:hypothetical protein